MTTLPHSPKVVRACGPALLRLRGSDGPRFLAILRGGRRSVVVLGPDLATYRVRAKLICAALCDEIEAPLRDEVNRLLDRSGVPARQRDRAQAAILCETLSAVRLKGCWLLRVSPGASFWGQLRAARLPGRLLALSGGVLGVVALIELALAAVVLNAGAGGWLLWGLLGFAPAFVFGGAAPLSLAVGLGGLLLAFRAFQKLALGGAHLPGAVRRWQIHAGLVAHWIARTGVRSGDRGLAIEDCRCAAIAIPNQQSSILRPSPITLSTFFASLMVRQSRICKRIASRSRSLNSPRPHPEFLAPRAERAQRSAKAIL